MPVFEHACGWSSSFLEPYYHKPGTRQALLWSQQSAAVDNAVLSCRRMYAHCCSHSLFSRESNFTGFFVNGASILRCSCSAAVANVSVQSDHVYNTASVTTLPVYLLYPMRRQAAIDSLGQPSGLPKIRLLAYLWTSGFPHRISRQRFYTCKFCHRWSLF